jgi:hypothetical protein
MILNVGATKAPKPLEVTMTIAELIESLENAKEILGKYAEVRIAYQPGHPLTSDLSAVTVFDPEEYAGPGGKDAESVYLATGGDNEYGSPWMWDGNLS